MADAPLSSSSSSSTSGKRVREAEPPPPPAKAAAPLPTTAASAPCELSKAELAAFDATEAVRADVRAARTRVAAVEAQLLAGREREEARLEAEQVRLEVERERLGAENAQLAAAKAGLADAQAELVRSEAAVAAFGGGGAEVAYTRRGELFLDVTPLTAARGYAAEASQTLWLCGLTWRRGDLGATNDMIVSSLHLQCGAVAARETEREGYKFVDPWDRNLVTLEGTTQLIRATIQNNLPRVLQLIQLGAPLDLVDQSNWPRSALHWASYLGHEHVVAALLEGKYKGADVDQVCNTRTALELASYYGHDDVVRVLLARGAKQVLPGQTYTAIVFAVNHNRIEVVKLLLAAPGAGYALKTKHNGNTPLKRAIDGGHAEVVALLRAAGAPE